MARLPGLGRTAGAAPYVAIAVGIISGQYIFNQPLKDYVAKQHQAPKLASQSTESREGDTNR